MNTYRHLPCNYARIVKVEDTRHVQSVMDLDKIIMTVLPSRRPTEQMISSDALRFSGVARP
jgi:hypothetical protein